MYSNKYRSNNSTDSQLYCKNNKSKQNNKPSKLSLKKKKSSQHNQEIIDDTRTKNNFEKGNLSSYDHALGSEWTNKAQRKNVNKSSQEKGRPIIKNKLRYFSKRFTDENKSSNRKQHFSQRKKFNSQYSSISSSSDYKQNNKSNSLKLYSDESTTSKPISITDNYFPHSPDISFNSDNLITSTTLLNRYKASMKPELNNLGQCFDFMKDSNYFLDTTGDETTDYSQKHEPINSSVRDTIYPNSKGIVLITDTIPEQTQSKIISEVKEQENDNEEKFNELYPSSSMESLTQSQLPCGQKVSSQNQSIAQLYKSVIPETFLDSQYLEPLPSQDLPNNSSKLYSFTYSSRIELEKANLYERKNEIPDDCSLTGISLSPEQKLSVLQNEITEFASVNENNSALFDDQKFSRETIPSSTQYSQDIHPFPIINLSPLNKTETSFPIEKELKTSGTEILSDANASTDTKLVYDCEMLTNNNHKILKFDDSNELPLNKYVKTTENHCLDTTYGYQASPTNAVENCSDKQLRYSDLENLTNDETLISSFESIAESLVNKSSDGQFSSCKSFIDQSFINSPVTSTQFSQDLHTLPDPQLSPLRCLSPPILKKPPKDPQDNGHINSPLKKKMKACQVVICPLDDRVIEKYSQKNLDVGPIEEIYVEKDDKTVDLKLPIPFFDFDNVVQQEEHIKASDNTFLIQNDFIEQDNVCQENIIKSMLENGSTGNLQFQEIESNRVDECKSKNVTVDSGAVIINAPKLISPLTLNLENSAALEQQRSIDSYDRNVIFVLGELQSFFHNKKKKFLQNSAENQKNFIIEIWDPEESSRPDKLTFRLGRDHSALRIPSTVKLQTFKNTAKKTSKIQHYSPVSSNSSKTNLGSRTSLSKVHSNDTGNYDIDKVSNVKIPSLLQEAKSLSGSKNKQKYILPESDHTCILKNESPISSKGKSSLKDSHVPSKVAKSIPGSKKSNPFLQLDHSINNDKPEFSKMKLTKSKHCPKKFSHVSSKLNNYSNVKNKIPSEVKSNCSISTLDVNNPSPIVVSEPKSSMIKTKLKLKKNENLECKSNETLKIFDNSFIKPIPKPIQSKAKNWWESNLTELLSENWWESSLTDLLSENTLNCEEDNDQDSSTSKSCKKNPVDTEKQCNIDDQPKKTKLKKKKTVKSLPQNSVEEKQKLVKLCQEVIETSENINREKMNKRRKRNLEDEDCNFSKSVKMHNDSPRKNKKKSKEKKVLTKTSQGDSIYASQSNDQDLTPPHAIKKQHKPSSHKLLDFNNSAWY